MATNLIMDGANKVISTHGMVSLNETVISSATVADGGGFIDRTPFGFGKGHLTAELFDKNSTLIASASKPFSTSIQVRLLAALTSSDAGSSATAIKWSCAPAEFASGTVKFTMQGALGGVRFRWKDNVSNVFYDATVQGNGVMEIDFPFTTVTV